MQQHTHITIRCVCSYVHTTPKAGRFLAACPICQHVWDLDPTGTVQQFRLQLRSNWAKSPEAIHPTTGIQVAVPANIKLVNYPSLDLKI